MNLHKKCWCDPDYIELKDTLGSHLRQQNFCCKVFKNSIEIICEKGQFLSRFHNYLTPQIDLGTLKITSTQLQDVS